MSGVSDNEAVVPWRERGEALLRCVRGRSKRGVQLAEEVVERLLNQEKDIEAMLTLLVQERERNEVLRAGQPGFSERNTQDGELERLRDYAVSLRLRSVALEKKLNAERQKVAASRPNWSKPGRVSRVERIAAHTDAMTHFHLRRPWVR